ncbi:MAG: hypothetical protein NC124_05000 [Clostridium sp.]|nr:hypothetical protein [Clostridium sp.]
MDILVGSAMEYIGGLIEGTKKTYIRFLNGCISMAKKREIGLLDLGVMIQNLIDYDKIFKGMH